MKNSLILSLALSTLAGRSSIEATEWTVPLAGNAFRTAPSPDGGRFDRRGAIVLTDAATVISTFVRADRPAKLSLSIRGRAPDGASTLRVGFGERSLEVAVEKAEFTVRKIGTVTVEKAGYLRLDLQGPKLERGASVEIQDLLVSSETEGLRLDYVKTNDGGMFYWGRRGPSVHLRYDVPRGQTLRHAYSEITVPKGDDPIGSYFMANGFGEGYFGIQVNSDKERRVLFSVWSPFKTDNPREVPEDQRIVDLGHGKGVHVGKFGNEGSGGQSYLVYPWKAGVTYRFLTEVRPDGRGNTIYTSWFGDKAAGEWRLIASFRRPKTDTNLRGFHSFLESFSPAYGHIGRRAFYGNVWVRDTAGSWHECTRARFSVDATGRGRHRLDFTGGSDRDRFFLRNCGFFNGTGRAGATFARESSERERPKIDFESLPRR